MTAPRVQLSQPLSPRTLAAEAVALTHDMIASREEMRRAAAAALAIVEGRLALAEPGGQEEAALIEAQVLIEKALAELC